MKLLTDLLTTDYGIMTVVGISFMLGMDGFFLWLFTSNMKRNAERAAKPELFIEWSSCAIKAVVSC